MGSNEDVRRRTPGRNAVGVEVRGDGKVERRDIKCRRIPESVASHRDR